MVENWCGSYIWQDEIQRFDDDEISRVVLLNRLSVLRFIGRIEFVHVLFLQSTPYLTAKPIAFIDDLLTFGTLEF